MRKTLFLAIALGGLLLCSIYAFTSSGDVRASTADVQIKAAATETPMMSPTASPSPNATAVPSMAPTPAPLETSTPDNIPGPDPVPSQTPVR